MRDGEEEKRRFLAVYDYGQGGIWVFIYARTPREVVEKYPELKVVEDTPAWVDGETLQNLEEEFTFDIDKPPHGWLSTLVAGRSRKPSASSG